MIIRDREQGSTHHEARVSGFQFPFQVGKDIVVVLGESFYTYNITTARLITDYRIYHGSPGT
jgi:hypothetical protein